MYNVYAVYMYTQLHVLIHVHCSIVYYFQKTVSLSWRLRMGIASQIADALNFLHTVNQPQCLVHGDVKR